MVDTYHKIKQQMCGITLGMEYSSKTGKTLLTLNELNILKERLDLFKRRQQWMKDTMEPLMATLNFIMNEVNGLGTIDVLDAANAQKYFNELSDALQNIKKEIANISTYEVWTGKTFSNGYTEKDILTNTYFNLKVKPIVDAADTSSIYSRKVLQLEERYNFLLRKQIAISKYMRLRTYLTPNEIQAKTQSVVSVSDVQSLENDNATREQKLAQYKTKLGLDGTDKTDAELDTALAPPLTGGNTAVPLPPPQVIEKPVEEFVEEKTVEEKVEDMSLEQDTDDEDIKTFKFTPTL
jgi:hypothetical protein